MLEAIHDLKCSKCKYDYGLNDEKTKAHCRLVGAGEEIDADYILCCRNGVNEETGIPFEEEE